MISQTFLADLAHADTQEALWETVKAEMQANGIRRLGYHPTRPLAALTQVTGPPPVWSWGFPEAWVRRYIDANFVTIDPIPEFALRQGVPVWWQEIADKMVLNDAQRAYLAELCAQNFGPGLGMAVYGPMLQNAYVGIGFDASDTLPTDLEIAQLQASLQFAHLKYCELVSDTSLKLGVLSRRERQVLALLAEGKSKAVTADLLGLSRHTVDTLLRRVFEKLRVTDRTSAVLLGIASGSIQIGKSSL